MQRPPPCLPLCRTFYRIWAFLILEFQVMSVLLWGWGSWYALTSVCLTHAGLSLLEQLAGAWTQRAPGALCMLGFSVLRGYMLCLGQQQAAAHSMDTACARCAR